MRRQTKEELPELPTNEQLLDVLLTTPGDHLGQPVALRRFYYIYRGIMNRCYRPEVKGYENYGGRGIGICERWQSYKNFREDMLDSYLKHLVDHPGSRQTSIDRLDNDGDYSPENCRWATASEQSLNRRAPRLPQRRVLTPTQVVNVLHCRGAVSSVRLSKLYGCSSTTISDIWTRKTWNPLPVGKDLYMANGTA